MKKYILYAVPILLLLSGGSFASQVGELNTFVSGQTASATDVNENFTAIKDAVDDNNAEIESLDTRVTSLESGGNSLGLKMYTSQDVYIGDVLSVDSEYYTLKNINLNATFTIQYGAYGAVKVRPLNSFANGDGSFSTGNVNIYYTTNDCTGDGYVRPFFIANNENNLYYHSHTGKYYYFTYDSYVQFGALRSVTEYNNGDCYTSSSLLPDEGRFYRINSYANFPTYNAGSLPLVIK